MMRKERRVNHKEYEKHWPKIQESLENLNRLREKSSFTVYGLVDPDTNKVMYIGVSNNFPRRLVQHLTPRNLKDNTDPKVRWILSLTDKGLKPELITIEENIPFKDRFIREDHWIDYYKQINPELTNGD